MRGTTAAPGPGTGRLRDALDQAVWESTAVGLAGWQLGLGVLAWLRTTQHAGPLLLAHGLLVPLTATAVVLVHRAHARQRVLRSVAAATFYALLLLLLGAQLVLGDDPMVRTVTAISMVVAATPFLLLAPGVALVCAGAPVGLVAVALARAGEGGLAVAVALPAALYAVAASLLMRGLRTFVAAADVDRDAAQAAAEELAAERAATATRAELVRTLHDTAVNTLAVVASGGSSTRDVGRLRRRCAEDVRVLRRGERPPVRTDLAAIGHGTSVDLDWFGDEVPDAVRLSELLGPARAAALCSMARELVLNAEKHAGTEEATVRVAVTAAEVSVEVSDRGRGFDPGATALRGLSTSVLGRGREHGIAVRGRASEGAGTSFTLTCPVATASAEGTGGSPPAASELLATAAWRWCVTLTLVGLVTVGVGSPTLPGLASVLLVGALSWWAWAVTRGGRPGPRALGIVVAVAVPVAHGLCYLGAAAGDPTSWQAIGLTPLLVVLLVVVRDLRLLALAGAALLATGVALAVLVWSRDQVLAGLALATAVMNLAQTAVWAIFVLTVVRVVRQAARDREQLLRDRADRAAMDVAATAQRHWRQAQVEVSVDLLAGIADGNLDPDDPCVRRRASVETHTLRQLLLLDPALVHLGPWLARCVARARRDGVRLTVRVGARDLPDEATAREVGLALEATVRAASPGTELVVAYFGGEAHPRVTVVGPRGFLSDLDAVARREVRVTSLAEHDLAEIGAR